jgi:hypothetical protein
MLQESKDGRYQTMGTMGVLLTLQSRSCVQVQVLGTRPSILSLVYWYPASTRRAYLPGGPSVGGLRLPKVLKNMI